MLFAGVLRHTIKIGRLALIDATGKTHVFQGAPGPSRTIRLHDRSLHWRLLVNPKLAFGEAWMDEKITCEDGTIYDLLDLLGRNITHLEHHPSQVWREKLGRFGRLLHSYNPVYRARRNVAHHYDLSGALYDLFLDKDRQYSCAYFGSDNDNLETAQANKKLHLAVRVRQVREGLGYRIYQVRKPQNRHLVDLRPVATFPPFQRVKKVRVVAPPELIANKVQSMIGRQHKPKGMIDKADLYRLLLAFPELKSVEGPVADRLNAAGATEEVLAAWTELVAEEILPEDEDDKF